ncbi:MAG: ABC transporter ATP-binding protein [Patescibacteria group bacterium]
MSKIDETKKTRIAPVLRAYFKVAIQYPWLLALIFLGGAIIEGAGVWSALVIKDFADLISQGTPTADVVTSLFWVLALFAGVSFLGWCGQRMRQLGLVYIEPKAMNDLSRSAFTYLIGHSHDFFASNFAGSLSRRVTRYARSFESVLDNISFNFYSTLLYTVGILVVLSMKSLVLGAIVLAWTIFFIYLQIAMAKWRQPLRILRAEEDSKVTGVLSDAIGNHSAISQFAAEKHEISIFDKTLDSWKAATLKSWLADNWIWAVQGLFVLFIEVAILAASILLWERGLFTVGDFVLIQIYIIGLIDKVWNIGHAMKNLYSAFAEAYEMVEIFEKPHAIQDVADAKPLILTKGQVDFNDVTFRFNEDRVILEKFNLTIHGGEKVALVGPSGAGKSTLTRLLLRLYDVSDGAVRIDGQDVRTLTQASLRENISFVPQEPVLFHRTLRENIAYGRPDATLEEIIIAAKKAHCHEFIDSLPQKYETYVGERGIKLSGGERQRVAIARAILKNAPVLILDEATSSLDSESEALIQDALRVLMEGKTVIVVAHRLSTIMSMDRILVIEGGRIAAEGTHDQLLDEKDGLYHKLWSIQAGGFLSEN